MTYVPGFTNDVFISYAHDDDVPAGAGWISQFEQRLQAFLEKNLGKKLEPKVQKDTGTVSNIGDAHQQLSDNFKNSAVLLMIVSPNYLASEYCALEREWFENAVAASGEFDLGNLKRIVRVLLLRDREDRYLDIVPSAPGFEFCPRKQDLDEDTQMQEFPIGSSQFNKEFDKLGNELIAVLQKMQNQRTAVFVRTSIEVTETESPAYKAWDRLRKHLEGHKYRVLPRYLTKIEDQLVDSKAAVFLLGEKFNPKLKSYVTEALRLEKLCMIWTGENESKFDADQQNYLRELRNNEKILFGPKSIVDFREWVTLQLNPPPQGELTSAAGESGEPVIYLISDDNPVEATRLESKILNRGKFRVRHLPAHPDAGDNLILDKQLLSTCDAIMLLWTKADPLWITTRSGVLNYPTSYRLGGKPLSSKGLCIKYPPQEAQEGFIRSLSQQQNDVNIVDQVGPTYETQLDKFLAPLRKDNAIAAAP